MLRNGNGFPWGPSGEEIPMHRGFGVRTLCDKCNSDTGGRYGEKFVDFIFKGYKFLYPAADLTSLTVPD